MKAEIVPDDGRLDQIADEIRDLYREGAEHASEAFECKLTIGRRLLEARERHPSDQAFGAWFRAQEFPFNQQWAHKLRTAATKEAAVREAVTTQVVTGGEPNIKAALEVVQRKEQQETEAKARQIQLADMTSDATGAGWKLLAGNFQDRLGDIPDGTIDLIITDPPYNEDDLPLWGELAKHGTRVLKPQGILCALSGKIQLPAVMDALATELQYGWLYLQPLPGAHTRIMARHLLQGWKPWLAYSNGPWPSGQLDWQTDVLDPSARSKDRYRWEQDPDPAGMLIDMLAPENGVICDPMAGTGLYIASALKLGRYGIAVEADQNRCATIIERLPR